MHYDDIYYLALRNGKNNRLRFTDKDLKDGLESELYARGPGNITKVVDLIFDVPVPRKPVYQDWYNDPRTAMTKKAADILKEVGQKDNQFFEANIVHKDETYPDHFIFKCNTRVKAMHEGRSIFEKPSRIYFIDRLSLDETVLDEIEEDKRLIMLLAEKAWMVLYHEKVVKALEAAEVTGVRFVKVKDWNVGSAFD
jgi:hypothetical protein